MTLKKPTELEKELLEENAMLRRKLSPLEDPEFTDELSRKLAIADLNKYIRKFRKTPHVVVSLRDIAKVCSLDEDKATLTNIGRSLQALCWERSAINGNLVFVMPLEEYDNVYS